MKKQTRAAVARRQGDPFQFEEVEIDDLRPDEVLVRIVACGICHTDIAARDGLFGSHFPAVFGHEGAGIVESVGSKVVRVRAGDEVVLSFSSCGNCSGCKQGHPADCVSFDGLNFGGARADGSPTLRDASGLPLFSSFFGQSSFALHSLVSERNVIPVQTAPNEDLGRFAPLGCGMQAGAGTVLNELRPRPGESLAVFGAGTVGLSAVMAGRMAGASPIVAVDIHSFRLELAGQLGATHLINGRKEDVGARLREILGEADHAVETTGVSRVIDTALGSLGPRGNLSLLGVSDDEGDEGIATRSSGPRQRVFYSIAGDSNPQSFIPFLIKCHRERKFPFDRLIREYPASQINEAVQDSVDGFTIKPLIRYSL